MKRIVFSYLFLFTVAGVIAQDIIVDVPAQSFDFADGSTFAIKASARKKPIPQQPVATVVGSIPNGSTISGNVTWTATITNSTGPVEFLIDGVLKWTEGIAPFEYQGRQLGLETKTLTNGSHVLTCRIPQASASANVTVSNATTPPPTTDSLSILAFGAKPNDGLDDRLAIQNAFAAGKSQGKPVFIPAGVFHYSSQLYIDSVDVFGAGDGSELRAQNNTKSVIKLQGTNPKLRNCKVYCPSDGQTRVSDGEHSLVAPWLCNGFTIDNVTIVGGRNSGILLWGAKGTASSFATIKNCRVNGSRGDAIHNTFGTAYVLIENNDCGNCGDDCIAAVSGSVITHHITMRGNRCGNNFWASGCTSLGGQDVIIEGNTIIKTEAAGIRITSETGSWGSTLNPKNIIVRNNHIELSCVGPNGGCRTGHPAIYIHGRSGYYAENIEVSGNTIKDPSTDGVRVDLYAKDLRFINNTFIGIKSGYKTYNISTSATGVVIQ